MTNPTAAAKLRAMCYYCRKYRCECYCANCGRSIVQPFYLNLEVFCSEKCGRNCYSEAAIDTAREG